MTQQNGVRRKVSSLRRNLLHGHRPKLSVQQLHRVPGIKQRSAKTKQSKGRQVLMRYAAADGGVRWINNKDSHIKGAFPKARVNFGEFCRIHFV